MEPGLKGLTPFSDGSKSPLHFCPWVLAGSMGVTEPPPLWPSGKASEPPKPRTMEPSLLLLGKGADHPEGQPAIATSGGFVLDTLLDGRPYPEPLSSLPRELAWNRASTPILSHTEARPAISRSLEVVGTSALLKFFFVSIKSFLSRCGF